MIIGKTLIPELLDIFAKGQSSEFLKESTDLCELQSTFKRDLDLHYRFQEALTSGDPINGFRDFIKEFLVRAPELDTNTIIYFVDRVKNLPENISKTLLNEIAVVVQLANKIKNPVPAPFVKGVALQLDKGFVHTVAKSHEKTTGVGNYFQPLSDSIGILSDAGEDVTDNTSPWWDTEFETMHPPINTTMRIFNKLPKYIETPFMELNVASEKIFRNSVSPYFKDQQRSSLLDSILQTTTSTNNSPLKTDTESYQNITKSASRIVSRLFSSLKDAFRLFDFTKRYNPQSPDMNFQKAPSAKGFVVNTDGYQAPVDMNGREIFPYKIPQTTQNTLGT